MDILYGLIFDVDGIIANTEPVNARATLRMLAELFNIQGVTADDFKPGLGRGAKEYVKAGARARGFELDEKQIREAVELRQKYIIEIFNSEPLAAFEGVLELINSALYSSSFRLAIATSANPEISSAILKAVNVPYQKMTYITGDEVKNKKPDPEIFLLAAEVMKLETARCVVIEDAPDGVAAAKAAGAKCIAVTNSTSCENLTAADLICDSLVEYDLQKIKALIDEC